MQMRRAGLLTAVALASVGTSIAGRIWVRGPYYPGFDVHGAANGLYLLSTRTPWDALTHVWEQSRTYAAPFPYFSALYALLPGALTAIWPWEGWAPVVTFTLFLLTLDLLLLATGVPRRDAAITLLAWGASPALLSFAVAGMAWVSGCLPHALALWVVLDERLRRRWPVNVALCLLTIELTWHVYELGKTACTVFGLGALVLRGVPLGLRAVWLAVAALQAASVFLHPSQHVAAYHDIAGVTLPLLGSRIVEIAQLLFVSPWLDLPVLVVAALLTCLRPSRVRLLLALGLLMQVGLLVAMSLRQFGMTEVRPRRFLLVDFYCLALVLSLWGESNARRLRGVLVAVLVAGNLWALVDLADFARTPWEPSRLGSVFTLPFVHSQSDYMLWPDHVDWVRELTARVDAGETVFLVYGLEAHDENFSNPDGILERLYVHLGHERFVQSVIVFATIGCHHDCIPVRPMTELDPFLDALHDAGPARWQQVVGYRVAAHEWDTDVFKSDRARTIEALAARFALRDESPPARVVRFRLEARSPAPGDATADGSG